MPRKTALHKVVKPVGSQGDLSSMSTSVAVSACCSDIRCDVPAAVAPGDKMFCGASELGGLPLSQIEPTGERWTVLQPHGLLAIAATSLLDLKGAFAQVHQ